MSRLTASADTIELRGKQVLIVEDEYFLALELADAVVQAGGIVLGPVPDGEVALAILQTHHVDAAMLDIRLSVDDSFPIARALKRRNIRTVFITGFDDWYLPADLNDVTVYRKPADPENVLRVLFPNSPEEH